MKKSVHLGLSEVKKFAVELAKEVQGGEIIALIGPLGSGKTTFTQSLAKALGVRQKVLSPTFILLQEFPTKIKVDQGPLMLIHLDLYRTKNYKEVATLGLNQLWGKPHTVTVIEWADKIKRYLPPQTMFLYLKRDVDL